jgi:hypothetical protein
VEIWSEYEFGKKKVGRMNAPGRKKQHPWVRKGLATLKMLMEHNEQSVDRHTKGVGRKERARSCEGRANLCGEAT